MNAFILYCGLVVLGLLLPRSRFILILQLTLMFILVGFNYKGFDILEYQYMFDYFGRLNQVPLGGEFIYRQLIHIFFEQGYTFFEFNIFTSAIATLIIGWFTIKHTENPALSASMLMIYPMFDFAIQKRNYIAMAIILIAFSQLIEGKKFAVLKYSFWNIVAFGFHSTYLVYLLYPIYYFISRRQPKTMFFLILGVSILMIRFMPNIAGLFFDGSKVSAYFADASQRLSLYSALGFIVVQVIFMILIWFVTKSDNHAAIKVSRGFVLYTGLTLPLYLFNSNFIRIFRNLLPFHYVALSDADRFKYGNILNMKLVALAFILYEVGISVLFYVLEGAGWPEVVAPLFDYNYIFELFG